VSNPAAKALWFIESHFNGEVTLDNIASACGVSRYHLSRVFGIATGSSIQRYVRGRRLTEAARLLAAGAPDILAVALDAGYGSHEAFTRAFRDQFGLTPEALRARGTVDQIKLMEPIKMQQNLIELAPPRVANFRSLLVAGLSERYNAESVGGIPAQWQRFQPYLGNIPGQVGRTGYGVIYNTDDAGNVEYMSGVEVSDFSRLPAELSRLRIPEQRYVVFTQRDHITTIQQTWFTIFNKGLPESGHQHSGGPEFERYGEEFNPTTGEGGFEIWIPVKP
jgi:AraC family transcriptional regulator